MRRWNGVAVVLGIVGLISGCGTHVASSQAKNNVASHTPVRAVTNTAGMLKTADQYLHGTMYSTLNNATSPSHTKGSTTKSTPSKSPNRPSSSKSTGKHTSKTITTGSTQAKTSSSSSSSHYSSGTSTATTKSTSPSSSGSKTATSTQSTSSSASNHTTSSSGTKTTTKSTSGGSTSKTSSTPTNTKPKTSGEDVWATNYLNKMYQYDTYNSGPNVSYMNSLTAELAKGQVSASTVKKDLDGLKPWKATIEGINQMWQVSYVQTWTKNFSTMPSSTIPMNNLISTTIPGQSNQADYFRLYVWYNADTKLYTMDMLQVGFEPPKVNIGTSN
ncbi:hypothetical protein [Alicyclobacillus sp. SO9]|uniref:hypothetical protein n=1 Tax=Alicyclobacillus sp. SO9 TaxID=2665646 RepID=UPI0018E6FFBE|nr:hypothetical protein [Alicyclobacillus sp. SO9]QQE79548.1 hypothetical protein GI364_03365 [Alicyclobacillus sp. SO9]